ncbi:MAG: immunoglobulin domain-containing protein, partial [Bacteroidetes bacterium]|nr:immunoglobulin domain-containing protein [Bacteroidota bacterium]
MKTFESYRNIVFFSVIILFISIIIPISGYGITKSAPPPPPANDECSGAIFITPTTTNFYTTYDNFNATVSAVTAPSCGTPIGGDVWFAVMVSSSGHLIFDSKSGSMTNGAMAIYTGGCGSLTLIACNDDKASGYAETTNPAYPDRYMPQIDQIGLPMYMLVYIRFWGKGATNFGTFQLSVISSPTQPPCTNLGFENDYAGWFATLGQEYDGVTTAPHPVYFPVTFNNTSDPNFTIVTSGTDPYGFFNEVYSGAKSLKIGDVGTYETYDGASVEQTFTVGTNTNFIYHYAVVLMTGGHPYYQQPFFQIDLFDQNGATISCGIYSVALPSVAFTQSSTNSTVYFKPWTPISVNLSGYVGQNVTIRFTVSDCSPGAHWGYAYLDCECRPFQITSSMDSLNLNGIVKPDTICMGKPDTLYAPPGALGYVWSPGGATTQRLIVSPTATTTYGCVVTTMGNTPCVSSAIFKTVAVDSGIIATATTNSPICPGDTFKLNCSLPGMPYYRWTGPNGFIDSIHQNTVRPNTTTADIGNYILTAKNPRGCTSKDTVSLAFYPLPTIVTTNGTACIGDTTTIIASGGVSYLWNTGSTNASTRVAPLTTTTYHVKVTDLHGCSDSSTAIAQIFPLPVIQITGDTNICKGDSTMLTASGGVSYLWDNTDTTAYTIVKPINYTTYKVIVKDINGCKDSLTKSVDIFPIPVPMIAVETDTICKGAYTTIT